jgi:hypothetical protein
MEHLILIELVDNGCRRSGELGCGRLHEWLEIGLEHLENKDSYILHNSLINASAFPFYIMRFRIETYINKRTQSRYFFDGV